MSTLDELKTILMDTLGIDDERAIRPEASFSEDLGADSLDLVELIMAIEEKFSIKIDDEEAAKLVTVQDAIDYLKDRGLL